MAAEPLTVELIKRRLLGRRRSGLDILIATALLVSLLVAVGVLVLLLSNVVGQGGPLLVERGFKFITDPLSPTASEAGLRQGLFGSVVLAVFVVLLAFPLGLAASIYLEEYAADTRPTRFLVANIRNLAGVPSIVYGLLGLTVFVGLARGVTNGRTLVAGGLTLTVLVLPIMIITASEALRAVPQALREASYGVGATRWETIRHHVLPVAAPSILTGSVLTIARAFGESAPLLLAGAVVSNFFAAPAGTNLIGLVTRESYTSLPVVIYNWARQPQEAFVELTAAGIIVLLIMLLAVNAGAILLRDRASRKPSL